MQNKSFGSASGSSIPSDQDHRKAELVETKTTCLIDGIDQRLDWRDTFAAWNTLKEGKTLLEYGDEGSVRAHVNSVLLDIEASLRETLGNDLRLSFYSELSTFGDAGDLWVVCANGMAVGVVEVKKPGTRAMTHENILGECFDYMQDVRGFDGLDHVFCILTTYQEWRVLWLPDCDSGARSTTFPNVPEISPRKREVLSKLLQGKLPPWPSSETTEPSSIKAVDVSPNKELNAHRTSQGSSRHPVETATVQRRVVHGGPILHRTDKALVPTIASVLVRMAFSPTSKLDKPLDLDRQYREVKPDSWVWKRLKETFTLSFDQMPDGRTTNFILLMPLGKGEHGITWLATSESGKACVIKFQANASNKRTTVGAAGHTLTDHHHFEREAALWREIWGAKNARATMLVNKSVLIMPYLKTCERPVAEQTDKTKELARKAIDEMLDRGYVHRDLRWDHVGLCRTGVVNDEAKAVFIDLGDVGEFQRGDKVARQQAKKEMLKALDLL